MRFLKSAGIVVLVAAAVVLVVKNWKNIKEKFSSMWKPKA